MTAPDGRVHHPDIRRWPSPGPLPRRTPAPTPDRGDGPTAAQLAVFARHVLAWHQVRLDSPHWCTCGQNVVLCAYRSAATRFLGPPTQQPGGLR